MSLFQLTFIIHFLLLHLSGLINLKNMLLNYINWKRGVLFFVLIQPSIYHSFLVVRFVRLNCLRICSSIILTVKEQSWFLSLSNLTATIGFLLLEFWFHLLKTQFNCTPEEQYTSHKKKNRKSTMHRWSLH